jgi:hypothetical protein
MLNYFLHGSLIKFESKSQSIKNIQYDYHLISSNENYKKRHIKEKHLTNLRIFLGSKPKNLTHVFHQWGNLKEEYGIIISMPRL